MTRIDVDGELIRALATRLEDIADYLGDRAALPRGPGQGGYGFIGEADHALESLFTDMERTRRQVDTALRELAVAARSAGDCYLETERLNASAMAGPR